MSKTQAITAFRIIFMMLWFTLSEIRGNKIDNMRLNELWNEAHKLMEE